MRCDFNMKTPEEQPSPLVDSTEMAAILQCSTRTVQNLRRRGVIPAIKVMSSNRFQPEEVIKALTMEAEVKQE